jgi:hypothetical protein
MRFTELERALIERLQLIEESDNVANSIAERSCASCERALIEAESRHAEEVNALTDEVIGVKLERDQLYELITEIALTYGEDWPAKAYDLDGYKVWLRLCREKEALRSVIDELAEEINAEAAQDETLRFTHEDRVVPTEAGAKAVEAKPLQLEVGKSYRRRDGRVVTVERNFDGSAYTFYSTGLSYLADGIFLRGQTGPFDLIEEVTESESAEVAA